jgi:hypothetical protein
MAEIDIVTSLTAEIGTLVSSVKNNPVSIVEIVINSIKYNPTAWAVSIVLLSIAVLTLICGLWTRRKDYIVVTIFLLIVQFGLTVLFYISAVSGNKIEFISW